MLGKSTSRRSSNGRTARLRRGKTGVAGAVRLQLSFLPVSSMPQPYRCYSEAFVSYASLRDRHAKASARDAVAGCRSAEQVPVEGLGTMLSRGIHRFRMMSLHATFCCAETGADRKLLHPRHLLTDVNGELLIL